MAEKMMAAKKSGVGRTFGGMIFLLLILSVFSACATTPGNSQAGLPALPVGATPTADQEIRFVQMNDVTKGWALGPNAAVLHTKDGALNWHEVTPKGLPATLDFVQFPDGSTAWLGKVTLSTDTLRTEITRTHDAGETWQVTQSQPVAKRIFSAAQVINATFVDANNGWIMVGLGGAAGSEGVMIFNTTDGGANWAEVESTNPPDDTTAHGLPLSGMKSGISFLTATRGWATGSIPAENEAWLYKSEDSGKSWQHQNLPFGKYKAPAGLEIQPPTFYSATAGILEVSGLYDPAKPDTSLTAIYKTTDGGETWNITTPVAVQGGSSVYSYDGIHTWILNRALNATEFESSSDAGAHWSKVPYTINDGGPNHLFKSVSFVTETVGWAVDKLGESSTSPRALVVTTDGGKTWKRISYSII